MTAQGARPETIGFDDFLRLIPKVELHCHLGGTLRPATLMQLAKKHGVHLPRPMEELYVYQDFYDFIDMLRQIALVLVDADDFALAIYQALEDGLRSGNQRHAEIFFNPQYFYPNGTRYSTMLDGLIEDARGGKGFWRNVPTDPLDRPPDRSRQCDGNPRRHSCGSPP